MGPVTSILSFFAVFLKNAPDFIDPFGNFVKLFVAQTARTRFFFNC